MTSPAAVQVKDLRKLYTVSQQDIGTKAAVQGLIRRKKTEVRAVDGISFELARGEIVCFLGPNGAGKTTTLKMLSGLLHPISGHATVLYHVPWKREPSFLRSITLVMGQRNLPVHPIHSDIADNLSSKLITLPIIIVVAARLAFGFHAHLSPPVWAVFVFIPALLLAFMVSFLLEWSLALVAFWTTRVSAVNQTYFVIMLFLSGQIAPLALLP